MPTHAKPTSKQITAPTAMQSRHTQAVARAGDTSLRDLRHAADASAGVRQLRHLQDMATASTGQPLQRVVEKAAVPWGPNAGKWVTTLRPGLFFDTQELAQEAEDAAIAAQQAAQEAAWQESALNASWVFANAGGRLTEHYGDGWGALYGITSHAALRTYIDNYNADGDEVGEHTIDLGTYAHDGEHVLRPCTIVYEVEGTEPLTVGPITRDITIRRVFHCGPSDL